MILCALGNSETEQLRRRRRHLCYLAGCALRLAFQSVHRIKELFQALDLGIMFYTEMTPVTERRERIRCPNFQDLHESGSLGMWL